MVEREVHDDDKVEGMIPGVRAIQGAEGEGKERMRRSVEDEDEEQVISELQEEALMLQEDILQLNIIIALRNSERDAAAAL